MLKSRELDRLVGILIGFVSDITTLVFVANRQAGVEQLGAQQAGDLIIHYDIGYRH